MQEINLIHSLKKKRDNHLAEIEKLKTLVRNIDILISAYSDVRQSISDPQLSLDTSEAPVDVTKMNLTDAILYVIQTQPNREWRGIEISKRLAGFGYKASDLPQRVSARLIERSKRSSWLVERIKEKGKAPRYRLK